MSAAARVRLWRERKREGLRVIPVEIYAAEIEALVRAGFLAPADAENRWAVGVAVAKLIEEWSGSR